MKHVIDYRIPSVCFPPDKECDLEDKNRELQTGDFPHYTSALYIKKYSVNKL